jgi:hypothetical protein
MEDISSSSGVLTRSSDQDHALALSQVEAHQENRDVKRSKHFVILALVVAAAVVATLVHISAAQDERQNFAKDVRK